MSKYPGNGRPAAADRETPSRKLVSPELPEEENGGSRHRGRKLLLLRYAAGAITGLLLVSCFPGLSLHWLIWVACVPLLLALMTEARPLHGFLIGYLCGIVFLLGSCYWFVAVTEHYGGLSLALSIGVLLLFALVLGVIFGAFGLGETLVARRSRPLALLLSPFLWVSLELARTYFLTGFPWNLVGYAVQATGLRQIASVTGVYGLSFLALSTSALIALAILTPGKRWKWAGPLFWIVILAVTNWLMAPLPLVPGAARAYLLQPDVPMNAGQVGPSNPAMLNRLVAVTEQAVSTPPEPSGSPEPTGRSVPAPLVVWSESPLPSEYGRDPFLTLTMQQMARQTRAYVVFNSINYIGGDERKPTNSAIVLDPDGREILQYDKIHLVPFGEYVPWWASPKHIGKIIAEVGDFVPGTRYEAARAPAGSIAIPICYEDVFPQLVRRLTPAGPGVIVNITDDAWYGDSPAAEQHFEISRLRAIENGRYLLRATNDGITAEIDPNGRVIARLPRRQTQVMAAHFSYLGGRTFYNAHGDVFAWISIVATAAIGLWSFVLPGEGND
jgi:apolipoprotein N-acyltransferase